MKHLIISLLLVSALSSTLIGQSRNFKWVVSTANGSELYGQSWATRTDFPKDFIKEQWNNGKQITSLNFGGGLWAVVFSKGADYKQQTWATRQAFPTDLIQEKWDEGFRISSAAYGQKAWAFVFSKTESLGIQKYVLSRTFPGDFIEENWDKGYSVSQVVFGDGQWLVIMSLGNDRRQSYIKSRTFPEEWIKEKMQADYEVTQTAFGNGYWTVVASQEVIYNNSLHINSTFPKNEIALAWAEEKVITNISFGLKGGENSIVHITPESSPVLVSTNGQATNYTPTLHLVCAMDTKDRLLGLGARHALQAIQEQFSAAAKTTGLQIHPIEVSNDNFTRNQLERSLEQLQAGPNDVIVFYYFGHGFRYTDNNSRFPICFVGKNGVDHPRQAALPLTDIYQQLTAKGARLTLVFAECCNNEIGVPAPVDGYIASRPMSVNFASKDRYKQLFLKQSGSILLASSDEDQASWATSTGGYFLDSFLDAFQYHVSEQNNMPPSWNTLLNDTQNRVKKLAKAKERIQEPIFSIQLN
ncbi:MAG: caspase family protein [Bacteroidota bacterium]